MKRIPLLALLIGLCPLAASAQFMVNVPVDLSRMPTGVHSVHVRCWLVCGDVSWCEDPTAGTAGCGAEFDPAELVQVWGDPGVSFADVQIPGVSLLQVRRLDLSTGSLEMTVPVPISVRPGMYPDDVNRYVCGMRLELRDGSVVAPVFTEAADEVYETSLTPFNPYVWGNFDNPSADDARCEDP